MSLTHSALQGPVRPVGGCWYLDFKLKGKGAKVFQPLPKGWTSFLYRMFRFNAGGKKSVANRETQHSPVRRSHCWRPA